MKNKPQPQSFSSVTDKKNYHEKIMEKDGTHKEVREPRSIINGQRNPTIHQPSLTDCVCISIHISEVNTTKTEGRGNNKEHLDLKSCRMRTYTNTLM